MDHELRVDWIACEAFGVCHDLAPDLIALDDWGYPILPAPSVIRDRAADVQRIVDCCPAKALRLVGRERRPARGAGRHRTAGVRA